MPRPTCKGCGAIIKWLKTPTGKSTPVDPERNTYWLVRDGEAPGPSVSVVTKEGGTVSGRRGSVITPGAEEVEGYVSHFATCPQAAQFRR